MDSTIWCKHQYVLSVLVVVVKVAELEAAVAVSGGGIILQ